jgi:Zn-dependent protease
MFTARWRLFRLMGIPISLDASWVIILLLIWWSTATFFRQAIPLLAPADYWVMGLVTALAYFVCIVLHELGHATVARAEGIPIRGITLFLFGGVAELGAEPPSAAKEFWMAIAGPVVSAVLGVLFAVLAYFGSENGWMAPVVLVLRYLAIINFLMLAFNLLPAFPLDGGRVLRAILWAISHNLRRATYWASLCGQGFAWLLIFWGVWMFFHQNFFGGIWMCLVAMFLNNAARGSYEQVLVRQVLQGETIDRFMNREPIVVPPTLDLRHWVEDYVYRYHRKAFPVGTDGHLEGFVSTQALSSLPREEWDRHTVGEVMRQDLRAISVPPGADALAILSKMQRTGSSRLLVTEGDRLLGIVSLKDLLRYLTLKLELEQNGPATNSHMAEREESHFSI